MQNGSLSFCIQKMDVQNIPGQCMWLVGGPSGDILEPSQRNVISFNITRMWASGIFSSSSVFLWSLAPKGPGIEFEK